MPGTGFQPHERTDRDIQRRPIAKRYRTATRPASTRKGYNVTYDPKRALELLRLGSGHATATFRDGQEAAIRHVVEGRGRLLVVQKTGWGKSFVYFIATKLLRETGNGPALLISPLLALMRNQIAAAERMGVRAATINSDNVAEWATIETKLARGEIDILLISPERLANERFRTQVLAGIAAQISLLVIDEAHCISDWGHDFRPHYRMLERIVKTLPPNLRLLATTATANDRVMQDLIAVLGPKLDVSRGDLNRASLTLQTIRLPSQAERLAWLAEQLTTLHGHGIIYTLTVRDAYQVADWLKTRGFNVEAYTGETGDRREQLEQALLDNQVKALVATTALGMGYDKPDLAFVIHYQMPGSVVAYYQQVGRAGRALDSAYGVLLSGQEETDISDWFIRSAFPTRQEVADVLGVLEDEPNGLSVPELLTRVNLSKGRVDKTIALLSLEAPAPIAKVGSKWQLTAATLSEGFWARAERLTALRRDEQQQMREYVSLPFGNHMGFLIGALDGDLSAVTQPALPPLSTSVNAELVKDAVAFLRRTSLPIEPRKKWPDGGMPRCGVKGSIAPGCQAQAGKALCVWGDAGWGGLVRQGKYQSGRFSDELVAACVKMIHEWSPSPTPTWVTSVPSLRHPELVPNFAQRLADALGLPYHRVIEKADERPEQKTMANSTQQARNIDGSLALNDQPIPRGPVLLVDDMVDSRWTLTVCAWLLRKSGSGEVWPIALSQTGQDE
jgi:ATP-dependent DNA helicase RecQ